MFDPKIFDDIAKCLSDAIPKPLRDMEQDLQKKFKVVLQTAFAKLDLVTRDEFDAQSKVLLRTREKLSELEAQLNELAAHKKPKAKPKAKKKPTDK